MHGFILFLGDLDDNDSLCVGPFKSNVDTEQWATDRGWPKNRQTLIFVVDPNEIGPSEFVYQPPEEGEG